MKRHNGKVTWFDEKNGFGFLACRHAADVFVDCDAVDGGDLPLQPGDRVLFEIVQSDVGPKARAVVRDGSTRSASPPASATHGPIVSEDARAYTPWEQPQLQTILVMEEDDRLRTQRSDFLCAAGYLVVRCHQVEAAAEVYSSNLPVDLVIVGLSPGSSLQCSLRKLDFLGPTVPVLVSAQAFPLDLWPEMQRRSIYFVDAMCSMPNLLRRVYISLLPAKHRAS